MKLVRAALLFVFLAPTSLLAQGVRMSPDFLPLSVGNRWVYGVQNEEGRKVGDLDFSIQELTILSGRSFYVFTRFPFVSEATGPIRLIRYDRRERTFLRMADDEEGALFLADATSTEVLEADTSGLPMKFVLHMDAISLTFQRGVGIIEARVQGANGVQIAKLTNVRIGQGKAPETTSNAPNKAPAPAPPAAGSGSGVSTLPPPKTEEQKAKALADNVTTITEENPLVVLDAVAVPEGHKFVLLITNISDKLLPFHFTSGQSYDFAVIDPDNGQEIWRWSRHMFFIQKVIRSEALTPKRNWKFEVTWNHRDDSLNPVPAGKYRVVGIVTTTPLIESDPLPFEVK